jgi:hypothetical protein
MDISRIASTICEDADIQLQTLFNNYVASVDNIKLNGFRNYCSHRGVIITEDMFEEILASNEEYLFTESEDGWLPISLDELESELDL